MQIRFKLMSEHASGLCSDLKPFVRGQVDGHIGLEGSQLENIVYRDRPGLVVRWTDGLLIYYLFIIIKI